MRYDPLLPLSPTAAPTLPRRAPAPALRVLLALLGLAPLLVGCGGGSDEPDSQGGAGASSLLLLTLDTTIPEALSCYRSDGSTTTPHLDALAAEGLLFENARTVTPMTLPSHASMLTGLVPPRHTVRMNGAMILPAEADTLAERAQARDVQTAAFVAAVVLSSGFGLEQGFDHYDQPASEIASEARLDAARRADEMVDRALAWLSEERDPERPFFLWLHLFDPHQPYDPPAPYLEAAGGNAYDGEVRFMDAEVGRLLDGLRELGLWDETVVAAVSDHGEGLGRHGQETHAAFVFDTTIRVPLILRHPDGRRAGERSSAVASVVDLFPTLVHALGWGLAGDVDGVDLWRGTPPADRGAYFESYYGHLSFGWTPITGWADADAKYHHSAAPELFDLRADPGELENLLPGEADRAAQYRESIARLARRQALSLQGVADTEGRLSKQIEALGYAGGAGLGSDVPGPLEDLPGYGPHERVEPYARFLAARDLLSRGRPAEALPLLEEIVGENPRNHSAAFNLGLAYMQVQRFEEALEALDLSIEHRRGEWMGGVLNKAVVLQNLGRGQEAVAFYEAAFRQGDGPPGALETFVRLLAQLGDEQRGRTYAERLRAAREGAGR